MKTLLKVIVCSIAIIATPLLALAAEPADLIKYRQAVMKAVGGHMGSIGAILQGKAGKPEHLLAHAVAMDDASKMAADIFSADSADGETKALPVIWEKTDEFQQALEKFSDAAGNFRSVAESGDMSKAGEAMKQLGGSCKNCHDNFREKNK